MSYEYIDFVTRHPLFIEFEFDKKYFIPHLKLTGTSFHQGYSFFDEFSYPFQRVKNQFVNSLTATHNLLNISEDIIKKIPKLDLARTKSIPLNFPLRHFKNLLQYFSYFSWNNFFCLTIVKFLDVFSIVSNCFGTFNFFPCIKFYSIQYFFCHTIKKFRVFKFIFLIPKYIFFFKVRFVVLRIFAFLYSIFSNVFFTSKIDYKLIFFNYFNIQFKFTKKYILQNLIFLLQSFYSDSKHLLKYTIFYSSSIPFSSIFSLLANRFFKSFSILKKKIGNFLLNHVLDFENGDFNCYHIVSSLHPLFLEFQPSLLFKNIRSNFISAFEFSQDLFFEYHLSSHHPFFMFLIFMMRSRFKRFLNDITLFVNSINNNPENISKTHLHLHTLINYSLLPIFDHSSIISLKTSTFSRFRHRHSHVKRKRNTFRQLFSAGRKLVSTVIRHGAKNKTINVLTDCFFLLKRRFGSVIGSRIFYGCILFMRPFAATAAHRVSGHTTRIFIPLHSNLRFTLSLKSIINNTFSRRTGLEGDLDASFSGALFCELYDIISRENESLSLKYKQSQNFMISSTRSLFRQRKGNTAVTLSRSKFGFSENTSFFSDDNTL